jgi:cell division protein FtsB
MSDTPVQTEIDNLRRSVRRWKALALTLLSGLVVVFIVGTTIALVQLRHARQEAHAARQAEMEARRQAEDARD